MKTWRGRLVEPLLLLETCADPEARLHEFAHFMQLVGTSSGALFTWGWAIALSQARMLRVELAKTPRALRLPFLALDDRELTPRGAAILAKLRQSLRTITRSEGPLVCALEAGRLEPKPTTASCPWVDLTDAPLALVPLGAHAIKEAGAEMVVELSQPTGSSPRLSRLLNRLDPELPAYWALSYARRRLGPGSWATTAACLDLSLMAPPDPGHRAAPKHEVHPGQRFKRLIDAVAEHSLEATPTRDGYLGFAAEIERLLGWRSWQQNVDDLTNRLVAQIRRSAAGSARARASRSRRLVLAELLEHGAGWRKEEPGALTRPGAEWLSTATSLAPLVRESGILALSPTSDADAPELRGLLEDAAFFSQMLFRPEVRCWFWRSDTVADCPEFESEERCPKYPGPPAPATDCRFAKLWQSRFGFPTSFPTGPSRLPCTECFPALRPRPSADRIAEFVAAHEARLPPDHLHAAYGGQGTFNPCLALITVPESEDEVSRVDVDHEMLHAIIAGGSVGRIMFLARFLTLDLWYRWAWGHISEPPDAILRLDQRFEELVHVLMEAWRPIQEGAAWLESMAALRKIGGDPGPRGDRARDRLALMNDVVTLGPRDHPVVRGWYRALRIDGRYGDGTFKAMASLFSDPAVPAPESSIEDWLASVDRVVRQALGGIEQVFREPPPLDDGGQGKDLADRLRGAVLPAEVFAPPDGRRRMWFDLLSRAFAHREMPGGYLEACGPILAALEDGFHGQPARDYGFSRLAFEVETTGLLWDEGPRRVQIRRKTRQTEHQVEHEINTLAALDFLRAQHRSEPDSLALQVRQRTSPDETWIQLLHDFFPFYSV